MKRLARNASILKITAPNFVLRRQDKIYFLLNVKIYFYDHLNQDNLDFEDCHIFIMYVIRARR